VVDIKNYDPEVSNIFSREVLRMIAEGESGWEEMLPDTIADLVKKYQLFGYSKKMAIEEGS